MAEVGETSKVTEEAPLAPAGSEIKTPQTDVESAQKLNIRRSRLKREAERKVSALRRSRGESV